MDLADELLLDLEGDEQVEEEEVPQNDAEEAFAVPSLPASATISKKRKASEEPAGNEDSEMLVDLPEGGQRPAEELDADAVEEMDLLSTADVSKVAKLFTQKSFQDALAVRLSLKLFTAYILIVCSSLENQRIQGCSAFRHVYLSISRVSTHRAIQQLCCRN